MATAASDVSQPATAAGRVGLPGRAILLVCTGLLVCLSGALPASGREQAEQVQPRKAAASETQSAVTIEPSTHSKRSYRANSKSGRVSIDAGTLHFLIQMAYGVHASSILYEVELDHRALYDVVAIPPDQRTDTAIAMIRDTLEATFDFDASLEQRRVAAYILQRLDGVSPLPESTSRQRDINRRKGRFSGTRVSMDDLTKFASGLIAGPVVDETGLDGVYDLIMEWDPSGGGIAWIQAFRDLGLELVVEERSLEQLVISRAEVQPAATSDE